VEEKKGKGCAGPSRGRSGREDDDDEIGVGREGTLVCYRPIASVGPAESPVASGLAMSADRSVLVSALLQRC
jgi:hypothetical protein